MTGTLRQDLQAAPVRPRPCARCRFLIRTPDQDRAVGQTVHCGWAPARVPLHCEVDVRPHAITVKMVDGPHAGDEVPCPTFEAAP